MTFKLNGFMKLKLPHAIVLVWMALGAFYGGFCKAQGTNLPTGIQDVIKLTRAGMTEEVILAQLRKAGVGYSLTSDQLVYLSNQGVSQNVIEALIRGDESAGGLATSAGGPQSTSPVTFEYFHGLLAPYGSWQQVEKYGPCWRPTAATADPNWRPYTQQGHWIYADSGWFWHSDYSWGQVTFHYGRWVRDNTSWVWVPGYDWAPAWVCWREAEGYLGWAALPPAATFKAGPGLQFDGGPAGDSGFGLGPGAFTFVPVDRFWDRNLAAASLPADRAEAVFQSSAVKNGFRMDHGRFILEGPGRDRIAVVTHHEVKVESPTTRASDIKKDQKR
jgi:hypothetical protein